MAWRVLRREPGGSWSGVNKSASSGSGVRRACAARSGSANAAGLLRVSPSGCGPSGQPGLGDRLPVRRNADGRRLKLANIVDEHTRDAFAMRVPARAPPTTSSRSWPGSSPLVTHPSSCGWTTAPSWSRGHCGTGAGCRRPAPAISSPARRRRTRSPSRSTGGPRRAAQPRGVQQPDRGPGRSRGLADRAQHLSAPLRPCGLTPAQYAANWTSTPQPQLS
jgi:hypothetical protein